MQGSLINIKGVLLDANGTLFDPAIAAKRTFQEVGLNPELVDLWFAEVLRDAFGSQLAGVFAPFRDWAGYHLHRRAAAAAAAAAAGPAASAAVAAGPAAAATALASAWAAAEPFPDVAPGLTALNLAGISLACLTNGSRDIASAVLGRAGLSGGDVAVYDVSEALAWKPAAEAYAFACNAMALPRGSVLLAAAHPWDCHGALQAGLQAAYIQRDPAQPYPPFLDQPQYVAKDFEELAAQVLAGSAMTMLNPAVLMP